jgi:predicted RecB family nuclease
MLETKHYCIKNINVENNSISSFNKLSRSVRYAKRNILKCSDQSKKRKLAPEPDQDPVQDPEQVREPETKPIKKRKIFDFSNMVSASSVRNYMLNDPLIDYLKEYNIYSLENEKKQNSHKKIPNSKAIIQPNVDAFTNYILEAGVEFENELIKIIKKDHQVVKVAEFIQCKNKEKMDETIELMKNGTPIIYQGVLHNYDNETFGMPDLLVRSDYINKLLGYEVISNEEAKIPSPNLNVNYHYKVIDIKHSNISLRADGLHILNSESVPAFKGQIYIYMIALNNILGININKAYVWGKRYSYESKGERYQIPNFLNKLGVIDYDKVDNDYINKTNNAIDWIKTVRNEGSEWTLLPTPCRNELYPNMKNDKDGPWRRIKNELNDKIHEITRVWNCGVKRRNQAHTHKVYSWKNPKCTSKIMGFNPSKTASTIDAILDINRQNKDIIRPGKILYDRNNWFKTRKDTMNFYLDFETLNSNLGSIIKNGNISYDTNQYIFLIGVGYANNNNWEFKSFLMKNLTRNAELDIFNEFYLYINTILKENKKTQAKFFHWSVAEPAAYNRFKSKNNNTKFNDTFFTFYDLNKVFISEPVTVKGSLDFSLKTIAKALHQHKMIKSCWDQTSPCSNGLSAMILANNLYQQNLGTLDSEPIMKEIINYNEIDCKVLYEIHELIINKL